MYDQGFAEELIQPGNGNMIQPSARATPRKVKNTTTPYLTRSRVVSLEVREKTIETQKAKIVSARKWGSSILLISFCRQRCRRHSGRQAG